MKKMKKTVAALLAVLTVFCCASLCFCVFAAGEEEHVHEYKPVLTVAPTCDDPGLMEYVCDCGEVDESLEEVVQPLGHDWGYWKLIKEATEEEEGLRERTCRNDSNHKQTEKIPKVQPEGVPLLIQKLIARIKVFFSKLFSYIYRD